MERSLASQLKFTGIQHVGITVKDMKKSIEFYTEVLGGQLVSSELGLKGDAMHNCLLQIDELSAISQNKSILEAGIPNLREGIDELDVYFIHFGNVNIELLQYRNGNNTFKSEYDFHSPAFIGNMHISFYLEDDIDVDLFAQRLEEECIKREIPNVKCNKICRVNNEIERKNSDKQFNSFKIKEGHFGGWTLFYVKGPNGEQLEFNQVTNAAKKEFEQGEKKYEEKRKKYN